ncbi:MAG: roadblock/LC7 domain-containing protein [bacterium]|nr:roadblock/LC7 domain-containing protein [bacterium]
MPFQQIMKELVDSTSGATDAIFVDWEGEAVDQYSVNDDIYRIKVVGAHKGVMLKLINDAQEATGNDKASAVSVKMKDASVLMASVKDGYYVALVLDNSSMICKASFLMKKAVAALALEM